jgi:acetylornithine deacetylase/succinyl-diaminopimelate desuccinylase-like protein
VVDAGIGSKRYKVDFNGPGGHSFGDFGIVSPAYAMADAITKFTEYPKELKNQTTFNVGIVEGGTSVNSIPYKVSMTVDMRSAAAADLAQIDEYFVSVLPQAVANENAKRKTHKGVISYKANIIGERPVGKTSHDTEIFKITKGVYEKFGYSLTTSASSTDSNVPMSLGIPALTLGSGIESFNAHSPEEYLIIEKEKNLKAIAANLAIVVLGAN